MPTQKTYGRDGPPQLQGYVEDVPVEVLDEWLASGTECVWTFSDSAWWRKGLKCPCESVDRFEVYLADATHPEWISGKFGGCQRVDVICTKCGRELPFFDDGIHGYNAVICDDRSQLPPQYLETNRALRKKLACDCGAAVFAIIAEAMYDCGDGIEDVPVSQWDDAYGAFGGSARCSSCGRVHEIANAETA